MILVSSCLGGEKVRYNGSDCLDIQLRELVEKGKAVLACPELLGGLSIPREPAEIQGGNGGDVLKGSAKIITKSGEDVTESYLKGAYRMLEMAKSINATCVVLKENSPSCGTSVIYSGDFNNTKVTGMGVTAALLKTHGFMVIAENELHNLDDYV